MPFTGSQISPIPLPWHAEDKVLPFYMWGGQEEMVLAGTDVKHQSRGRFEQTLKKKYMCLQEAIPGLFGLPVFIPGYSCY